ncbi:hypothetical protein IAU60_000846 [Kwoniella sp. DSM 27419]
MVDALPANPPSQPASSLKPSPFAILDALRAVLTPAPILSHTPDTLRLFAHVQLQTRAIRSEARRVLKAHQRLTRRLARAGCSPSQQVEYGVLNEREGLEVSEIWKRWKEDADDRMMAFSLGYRKFHTAKVLSTPKINPAQVLPIINNYFPNDLEAEGLPLYIRCMTSDQLAVCRKYRTDVMAWYDRAQERFRSGLPALDFTEFYPRETDNGQKLQDSLVHNIIRLTEHMVEDVASLEALFAEPDEDMGVDDAQDYATAEYEEELEEQRVLAGTPPFQHRPVGPRILVSLSPSPSPVDIASAGRVTTSANLIRPIDHHVPILEVAAHADGQAGPSSQAPLGFSRRKTLSHFPVVISPAEPRSSLVTSPQVRSSPTSKKRARPRQSFPPTGPDYRVSPGKHAPSSAKKQKLRPFDNSELVRR